MIEAGTEREGRRVVYRSQGGPPEPGYVSSWNEQYVFVRFDADGPEARGKACSRRNLTWEGE